MIKFIKEIKSVISNNAPLKEAIIFATDTKELFVDINNTRLQINDVVVINNVADLDDILAPLSNKFYFCQENNIFYRYTGGSWLAITSTQAQYQELLDLYTKLTVDANIEYILLADQWVGNTYTINNSLFTEEATIRLSASNISDNEYTALSTANIMPDDSDISNNNIILVATGEVPAIDIPIIVSVYISRNDLENVEDNLTSTSSINPLSGNMGRELNERIGNLNNLSTENKDNIVVAINEIVQDIDDGKTLVANAITNKGIHTSSNSTYEELAYNIDHIVTSSGAELVKGVDSTQADVLEGKKFINDMGELSVGTIPSFDGTYSYRSGSSQQVLDTKNKYLTDNITIETLVLEETKEANPTSTDQVILPSEGYDGLHSVTVKGDANLNSSNIRDGVTIFGVTGNANLENVFISDTEPTDVQFVPSIWLDTSGGKNLLKIYDGTKWISARGTWS